MAFNREIVLPTQEWSTETGGIMATMSVKGKMVMEKNEGRLRGYMG